MQQPTLAQKSIDEKPKTGQLIIGAECGAVARGPKTSQAFSVSTGRVSEHDAGRLQTKQQLATPEGVEEDASCEGLEQCDTIVD